MEWYLDWDQMDEMGVWRYENGGWEWAVLAKRIVCTKYSSYRELEKKNPEQKPEWLQFLLGWSKNGTKNVFLAEP